MSQHQNCSEENIQIFTFFEQAQLEIFLDNSFI